MKRNICAIVLIAISLAAVNVLASCNKKAKKIYNVGVDVQTQFENDKVQIYIDDEQILDKQLTTNDVLGVCLPDGIVHKEIKEGKHKLKVVVNGSATKTEKFSLTEDVYIGVRYDRSSGDISYLFQKEKFMYD
ncbi:hypothetical protein [Polluticoccus soli]|uniref:hypothetical protein n=1 Tax=Polluticoccus soli TaxID=3034150 RepID=UPI0023E31CE3|nr:hypothetical protein [Flavipsychrobacter sp. JY13-12]